ncbi:MAG: O-methyltransferase [Solirubrobacteraceae bacterium]
MPSLIAARRRAAAIVARRASWLSMRLFYRYRAVRELVLLLSWPRLRRQAPDLAHIPLLKELVVGPVRRDEALALFGLVRVLRPAVVVEIGFFRGQSAFNFLRAMDAGARLYSFDIDPECAAIAHHRFAHDPRLRFRLRSQGAIEQADLDGDRADLIFLDASHDLALNKATFARLRDVMAERALLIVHDTGTLPRHVFPARHPALAERDHWIGGDEYEHLPDERAFVNWILDTNPEFAQIHLHSNRTLRWGLTLLQRTMPLPRSS